MSLKMVFLLAGAAGLVGIGVGYFLRWIISLGKKGSVELEIKQLVLDAREEAKKITDEAKTKAAEVKKIKEKVETMETQKQTDLEKIAKLSESEAKQNLLSAVEKKFEEDITVRMQKLETVNQEKLEKRAQEIITTAIQRFGNSVTSDVFTTMVTIPSDEIKGKIIGKEGRNIKAFERVSGVEVIVDDTPGAITLSSFDPVRRQVARVALENLILDGRIQPAKIEKEMEKAEQEINKIIKEKGQQAAFECGVYNLDPRITSILGRLHFRTSYGQNVLQQSVEMAHMAGVIAEELGANVAVAKAGALLHDIGKAVDHEVSGTHVEIGRRILQKFRVDQAVIKAMQSH